MSCGTYYLTIFRYVYFAYYSHYVIINVATISLFSIDLLLSCQVPLASFFLTIITKANVILCSYNNVEAKYIFNYPTIYPT